MALLRSISAASRASSTLFNQTNTLIRVFRGKGAAAWSRDQSCPRSVSCAQREGGPSADMARSDMELASFSQCLCEVPQAPVRPAQAAEGMHLHDGILCPLGQHQVVLVVGYGLLVVPQVGVRVGLLCGVLLQMQGSAQL